MYVQRVAADQAAIERRLVELGVDDIQAMLRDTTLNEPDAPMHVDGAPPPPAAAPRPISAKQRALEKYVRAVPPVFRASLIMRLPCPVCAH